MTGVVDEKKRLALKVLTCWMDGKAPSSEDVQQLRCWEPELGDLQPDELACVVINEGQNEVSAA